MKRDYKLYIKDIIDSINKIQFYIKNINEEQFNKDDKLQDAVLRRLEIIGEAIKNIPRAIKQTNKNIPWASMSAYRDVITHSYFGISLSRVWKVAKFESLKFKESLQKIKML